MHTNINYKILYQIKKKVLNTSRYLKEMKFYIQNLSTQVKQSHPYLC